MFAYIRHVFFCWEKSWGGRAKLFVWSMTILFLVCMRCECSNSKWVSSLFVQSIQKRWLWFHAWRQWFFKRKWLTQFTKHDHMKQKSNFFGRDMIARRVLSRQVHTIYYVLLRNIQRMWLKSIYRIYPNHSSDKSKEMEKDVNKCMMMMIIDQSNSMCTSYTEKSEVFCFKFPKWVATFWIDSNKLSVVGVLCWASDTTENAICQGHSRLRALRTELLGTYGNLYSNRVRWAATNQMQGFRSHTRIIWLTHHDPIWIKIHILVLYVVLNGQTKAKFISFNRSILSGWFVHLIPPNWMHTNVESCEWMRVN